jgi:hypothetical protein
VFRLSTTWTWALALLLLAPGMRAATAPTRARHVTVPLYAEGQTQAVAVARIDSFFTDHRRLGFFRVKLMPLLVAAGVRLEVGPGALRSNVLAGLQHRLETLGGRTPVEIRDFALMLPGETEARLAASKVRFAGAASLPEWWIEGGTLRIADRSYELPKAQLLLRGKPGCLVWQKGQTLFQYDFVTENLLATPLNRSTLSP